MVRLSDFHASEAKYMRTRAAAMKPVAAAPWITPPELVNRIFNGAALGDALPLIADHLTERNTPIDRFVRGCLIPQGYYEGGGGCLEGRALHEAERRFEYMLLKWSDG